MPNVPTQEDLLTASRKGREALIAAIKAWLETVRTANDRLMSVHMPLTGRLPKLPSVGLPFADNLPFADKLPSPKDAVAGAYDLAERLLADQRRFAEELVRATAPLMPRRGDATAKGNGSSEPEVPARKAWAEAVAVIEPEPVAVIEPKPVAVKEPEPVAVIEPKPVAVIEPEPVAAREPEPVAAREPEAVEESAKKPRAAKSTGTARGTGTARRSTGTRRAAKPTGADGAPKDATSGSAG